MNDGGVLLQAINTAYLAGEREYTIPRGTYSFLNGTPSFRLIGVDGLAIYAYGVEFIFEPRLSIAAVNLVNCSNISIFGLSVDFNPIPFSQGTISAISKNSNYIEVTLDNGYPIPDINWSDIGGGNTKTIVFHNGKLTQNKMDWVRFIENTGENKIRCYLRQKALLHTANGNVQVGSRIALPDRKARQTLVLKNSHSCNIVDWKVYSSPQMVFVESEGLGNNRYEFNRIVRRHDRLLTSNADVFHSINVEKGPIINNNFAEFPGDDFVNIHTHLTYVAKNGKDVLCFCNTPIFSKTTSVNVYDHDLSFKGIANISNVQKELDQAEIIDALANVAHFKLQSNYQRWTVYRITSDLDLSIGDLIDSPLTAPHQSQVTKNRFDYGYSRGVLVKSSNSIISDNYINTTGGAAIHVGLDRFWLEGGFTENTVVSDNICRNSHILLNTPPPTG